MSSADLVLVSEPRLDDGHVEGFRCLFPLCQKLLPANLFVWRHEGEGTMCQALKEATKNVREGQFRLSLGNQHSQLKKNSHAELLGDSQAEPPGHNQHQDRQA